MDQRELVATTLEQIARYLELEGANPFKVRAFSRAAEAVRDLGTELEALIESNDLDAVEGIGSKTGQIVREIVATGESTYLEELRSRFPPGLLDLETIPGLGLKKIRLLWQELGIASLEDLEMAIDKNAIAELSGFGLKTQRRIAEGLRSRRRDAGKVLLWKAIEVADRIVRDLSKIESIDRIEISGSIRRRLEVVERIVIVGSTARAATAGREIVARELPERFEAASERRLVGRSLRDLPVEILLVEQDSFVVALLISTGTDAFVQSFLAKAGESGLEISFDEVRRKGRKIRLTDEAGLFESARLGWIPPELREEPLPATGAECPGLVEASDLRGTFHAHSTWSDGRSTLREMVQAASDLGLEYIGISDHSKSAGYAKGLSEERVDEQLAEIEELRTEFPSLRIFHGTECDILADGSLDYDAKTLAKFEFVIASVHSGFTMNSEEMTDRIVRAIRNPFVTFIGHLTGRKLLLREGYRVQFESIFEAAAKHDVMIEINGHPRRLDLDWRLMTKAIEAGVRLSIHPDAHARSEFAHLLSGTWAARKGGVRRESIFNTQPVEAIEKVLEVRRRQALETVRASS